jgi:hypothetical protein
MVPLQGGVRGGSKKDKIKKTKGTTEYGNDIIRESL